MKNSLLFMSLLSLFAFLRAGEPIEIPLPVDPTTINPLGVFEEEVQYRKKDLDEMGLNRRIAAIEKPTVTLYYPESPAKPKAGLLICPGGGYKGVVIDKEGHALARYFQKNGLLCGVLKYRLPLPLTDSQIQSRSHLDALAGMKILKEKAQEQGIPLNRVGILGCSAGGHLAGSVTLLTDPSSPLLPGFTALLYPVISMETNPHEGSKKALLGEKPKTDLTDKHSLEKQIRKGLPPFFIVHAKDDQAVSHENSLILEAALKAQNVPILLKLYETGGHGFGLREGGAKGWEKQFLTWLDTF